MAVKSAVTSAERRVVKWVAVLVDQLVNTSVEMKVD